MTMTTPAVTVTTVCATCSDYAEEGSILKPHGDGWRHISNNSVRCPGQEDDGTDDRAVPVTRPADTASSASVQFRIDTGHYLPLPDPAYVWPDPDDEDDVHSGALDDDEIITLQADLDPDALVVLPDALADLPGVQTDDGVTAIALIDLARHIVSEHESEDAEEPEPAPSRWPDRNDVDSMIEYHSWISEVTNENTTLGFRDWLNREA